MRIAIFTDNFLPGTGGTENAVLRFAAALSKAHEVLVVAPDYHIPFDDEQFPFTVKRVGSIRVTANDCMSFPYLTAGLKRALDEFHPDVVHTHTLGMMAGYANRYAKKHGIPSICTIHTKYRYCYKRALKSTLLAAIVMRYVIRQARRADKICTVADCMVDELMSYGLKRKAEVVRNGNDAIQKIPHIQHEGFVLLYVGLVIDYKNIAFSLECLKELKNRGTDFKFLIVGNGPHIKSFEKRAKKAGISNNVEFRGAVTDRNELSSIYASADLLLFTSIFDNDPLVILEAAGAGTPSLVLEGTGASERITDSATGFIAKNSAEAVADKIQMLISDRNLLNTVGQNAGSLFSPWGRTAEHYIGIYNDLIQNRS